MAIQADMQGTQITLVVYIVGNYINSCPHCTQIKTTVTFTVTNKKKIKYLLLINNLQANSSTAVGLEWLPGLILKP